MTRFLRYLRIAFSAVCGIVSVLLLVLWCTSYFWASYISQDVDDPKIRFKSHAITISSNARNSPDYEPSRFYVASQLRMAWWNAQDH